MAFFIADPGRLDEAHRDLAFDPLRRHLADDRLEFKFVGVKPFVLFLERAVPVHADREILVVLDEVTTASASSRASDGDRDDCRGFRFVSSVVW